MKKSLLSAAFCLPFFIAAQNGSLDNAVKFEKGQSWRQLKQKAKDENKYIFMDVYASWCLPCKKMDKEVYSNDTVGSYINTRFVSVKVQMDTSNLDDDNVKSWYADAFSLAKEYKIDGYPSFLFFNSDGKLIYKDVGYKSVSDLIKLTDKALDPRNIVYYGRLEDYKNGKTVQDMDSLAIYAQSIGEVKVAHKIAQNYIANVDDGELFNKDKILFVLNVAKDRKLSDSLAKEYKLAYLDNLSEEELSTQENLLFLNTFINLINSKGKVFRLCYHESRRIDSIIGYSGWAKGVVEYVITREELDDKLIKNGKPLFRNPDWNTIRLTVQKKYKEVNATLIILRYKIQYYKSIQKWNDYVKAIIEKVDNYWTSDSQNGWEDFDLNNQAWEIFLYSSDKFFLEKALVWSDTAIKMCNNSNKANWMDTKANLLYKLGRVKEAIAIEHKVVELDSKTKEFQHNLQRMREGKPTWPTK